MKTITCTEITNAVEKLCIDAAVYLPVDIKCALITARENASGPGKTALQVICENFAFAEETRLPLCQDTGMAVIFADIGQDIYIIEGNFEDAVNEGVRRGYEKGFLRKSVVSDPLLRENTNDNTPCIIYTRLVSGNKLTLTIAPKGFGSENMSALKCLLPTAGREDVINFAVETIKTAGAKPCPPVIVGIGLGGTSEKAGLLAKKALLRPVGIHNKNPFYAEIEEETLDRINCLDIGPQGFGGSCTALSVNIEVFPTHIAGMPCAINIGCHCTRHATCVL